MTKHGKIWTAVGIVLTLAILVYASGACYGTRTAEAGPRIGTALTGERRVTELEPLGPLWGVRRIERSTYEPGTRTAAGRIIERSRTERTSACVYFRPTGTDVACMWQEVHWEWRYNFDKHRASWISVDWDKWTWRSGLPHPIVFRSWDGSQTRSGELASAGENLQWKERQIWATFESCAPLVGCGPHWQLSVAQHIRNYDDGHYRVL